MYMHIFTLIFLPFALFSHKKIIFGMIKSKGGNTCIEANISEHSLMRINEITKVFKILE